MAVLSIALGWWVAGRALRPLRTITSTTRRISASNLHERLDLAGPDDEVTELGQTLDDLFERLETSFQTQGHFVANASHELRTPLAAERALLQVALADPDVDTAALRHTCEQVLTLGAQQEELLDALLTLASSERGISMREPIDLAGVVDEVVEVRRTEFGTRGVAPDVALNPARATGDRRLVEVLVANLIDNAVRHNMADGRVQVSTTTTGDRAVIAVGNTGPLVPPDQVDRLFQPFERLEGGRSHRSHGHGLGLAIVRAVADTHGAEITARARPAGGLDVAVSFRADRSAESGAS